VGNISFQIINVLRNPRDVCVSFLNHFKVIENYKGTLETIADMFLRDVGPYYTPFFKSILSYWNQRSESNILTVHYEDMKRDLASVIKKVAEFLEIEVTDDNVA